MSESNTPYIGAREAAAALGLRPYQLVYLHKVGHVAEPPRLFGRRCYDEAAMARLHEFVSSWSPGRGRPARPAGEEGACSATATS